MRLPTKISNKCSEIETEGLHMTEDEYKIKIIEMVNTITELKILRRIYLFIVTIVGSFH